VDRMTEPAGGATPSTGDAPVRRGEDEPSLGELVSDVAEDLQRLFRQELQLAKVELKEEAGKAGKAAGLLGGAGFAGYLVVLLLTLAAVFALANVMDPGWAALIVAVVWAVIGAVLYVAGRGQLRQVSPAPTRTIESLKEDAKWARHPTS
jgi:hypothetical protein